VASELAPDPQQEQELAFLPVQEPEYLRLEPEYLRLEPEYLRLVSEHPQPGLESESGLRLRFPPGLLVLFQSLEQQRFPWRVPLPLFSTPLQIACSGDCNRRLRSASSLRLLKPAKISS
jgi:hypothetical protein